MNYNSLSLKQFRNLFISLPAPETDSLRGIYRAAFVEPAWLWVFTNQKITVYTIETSRGHEVVVNILGKEFKGVLVSDCFLAYDHHELENWLKQKCLSHLLKDLKELTEMKVRGAVRFARAVTELLQSALALKTQKDQLSAKSYARQAKELEVRLDELIDAKRDGLPVGLKTCYADLMGAQATQRVSVLRGYGWDITAGLTAGINYAL